MDLLGHHPRSSGLNNLYNNNSGSTSTNTQTPDITLFDDLAHETKEAAERAVAGGDYKKQIRWNTLRRHRLKVTGILLCLWLIMTILWIIFPPDYSWTINRSLSWLFISFTLFCIQILACLLAHYRYRLLLDLLLGFVYFGVIAVPTLYCVGYNLRLDQRTLFIISLFIYYYPLEIELSYHVWRIVSLGVAICFALSVAWVQPEFPATWLDRAILTSFAALFTVLTYLPQRFLFILTKNQRNVLETLASESRAQLILLKRVIPDVFIEQLLDGSKRMTSNPIDHVTVLFCEVMVLHRNSTTGEILPKKIGHNIDEKSLAVLSEVFNILDNVVSRNGVYKVETIFSEFVAVSGLPRARSHHINTAYAMVITAIDMLREVHWALKKGKLGKLANGIEIDLQIGINTGSVVESILGRRLLPRWKLFGDTVNTASRMKSNGICGRIHLSRNTRDHLMSSAPLIARRALEDTYGKLSTSKQKLFDELYTAFNLANIRRSPRVGGGGMNPSPADSTKSKPNEYVNILTPTGVTGSISIAGRVGNLPINFSGTVNSPSAATSTTTLSEQDPECLSDLDILFGRITGFFCRPRPPMSIKGKGIMCTYIVELCVPDITKHHMDKIAQRMLGRNPSVAELRVIHDVQEIDETTPAPTVTNADVENDEINDLDDILGIKDKDSAGNDDTSHVTRDTDHEGFQPVENNETSHMDPALLAILQTLKNRSPNTQGSASLPPSTLSMDPHVLLPSPEFLLTEPGALSFHPMKWFSKHDKLWTYMPLQIELLRRLSRRVPRRWSGRELQDESVPTEASNTISRMDISTNLSSSVPNIVDATVSTTKAEQKRGIGGHRLMDIVSGDIRPVEGNDNRQRFLSATSSSNQLSLSRTSQGDISTEYSSRRGIDDEDDIDETDMESIGGQSTNSRQFSTPNSKNRGNNNDHTKDASSMLADKFMSLAFGQAMQKDSSAPSSRVYHPDTSEPRHHPSNMNSPSNKPYQHAPNHTPIDPRNISHYSSGSRLYETTSGSMIISGNDSTSPKTLDRMLQNQSFPDTGKSFQTDMTSTLRTVMSNEQSMNQLISPGDESNSQYSFDALRIVPSYPKLSSKLSVQTPNLVVPIPEENETTPSSTVLTNTSNQPIADKTTHVPLQNTDNHINSHGTSAPVHGLRGFVSQGHVRTDNHHTSTDLQSHPHRYSYPLTHDDEDKQRHSHIHNHEIPDTDRIPTSTFEGAIDISVQHDPATMDLLASAILTGNKQSDNIGNIESDINKSKRNLPNTNLSASVLDVGDNNPILQQSMTSITTKPSMNSNRSTDLGEGESVLEPELDRLRIFFIGSQEALEPIFVSDHINQYSFGAWAALLVITFVSVNTFGLAARFQYRNFAIFVIVATLFLSFCIFFALIFKLVPLTAETNTTSTSTNLAAATEKSSCFTRIINRKYKSKIMKLFIQRLKQFNEWFTIEKRAKLYAFLVITQVLLVLISMDLVLFAVSQGEQRIIFDWENTWGTVSTHSVPSTAKGLKPPPSGNNNFPNNSNSSFKPDFSFIICTAAFVITLMAPYYYGLLYYHHLYLAGASLIVLIPALAIATPPEWQTGIGWLLVILLFTLRSVRRTELRLRTSFLDRQLVKEQQARTKRMLHAMLPEKIADQMMKKEDLQADKNKSGKLVKEDSKTRDAYEYVCDILGKTFFQYILGFSWFDLRPRMWCFHENFSNKSNEEEKGLHHHSSSHSTMDDDKEHHHHRDKCGDEYWNGVEEILEHSHKDMRQLSISKKFTSSIGRTIRSITNTVRNIPSSDGSTALDNETPNNVPIGNDKETNKDGTAVMITVINPSNRSLTNRQIIVKPGPELSFLRAQTYEVSLLMFDLVGFTSLSADVGPRAVVELLDRMYNSFDRIVSRRGARKIETIGDAFLVACGVPDPVPVITSASIVAKCALDMLRAVESFSNSAGPRLRGHRLQARIGIHCGRVLAGVIGDTMPRYQLFGSSVDEVQAMESSSEPGQVHASSEILQNLTMMVPVNKMNTTSDSLSICVPCCKSNVEKDITSHTTLSPPRMPLSSTQVHPEPGIPSVTKSTNSTTENSMNTPIKHSRMENPNNSSNHTKSIKRASGGSAYMQRAVPDIKVTRKLEDGSGFIARDRTGGMVRGIAW